MHEVAMLTTTILARGEDIVRVFSLAAPTLDRYYADEDRFLADMKVLGRDPQRRDVMQKTLDEARTAFEAFVDEQVALLRCYTVELEAAATRLAALCPRIQDEGARQAAQELARSPGWAMDRLYGGVKAIDSLFAAWFAKGRMTLYHSSGASLCLFPGALWRCLRYEAVWKEEYRVLYDRVASPL